MHLLAIPRVFVIHESTVHLIVDLGDNCIQNFHLGSYNVGYTVGNLVLRRRANGVVKRHF